MVLVVRVEVRTGIAAEVVSFDWPNTIKMYIDWV